MKKIKLYFLLLILSLNLAPLTLIGNQLSTCLAKPPFDLVNEVTNH